MDDIADPRTKTASWPLRKAPHQRVKIYVGEDMVGVGKVRLLACLDRHGSIAAAAEAMGVNVERAWFLLETLQNCFQAPLYVAARGSEEAPAEVTPLGRELIARYDDHVAKLDAASLNFLAWLEAHQREIG